MDLEARDRSSERRTGGGAEGAEGAGGQDGAGSGSWESLEFAAPGLGLGSGSGSGSGLGPEERSAESRRRLREAFEVGGLIEVVQSRGAGQGLDQGGDRGSGGQTASGGAGAGESRGGQEAGHQDRRLGGQRLGGAGGPAGDGEEGDQHHVGGAGLRADPEVLCDLFLGLLPLHPDGVRGGGLAVRALQQVRELSGGAGGLCDAGRAQGPEEAARRQADLVQALHSAQRHQECQHPANPELRGEAGGLWGLQEGPGESFLDGSGGHSGEHLFGEARGPGRVRHLVPGDHRAGAGVREDPLAQLRGPG
ncbi:hypothetical protein OJ252_3425 [Cryptosporidium canis]|uniref:Uncharacterized protein n=1 Tax=Cryptosporidium canis TaxID=195482 RepID=A0ABQ8P3H3_9CRYT|nr:hypothetical protein OJ252_3425 [Cryptosporidium canis]